MNSLELGVAVASTFGVLTLAPISRPSIALAPAPAPIVAQATAQAWTYQIDTSTLKQYLNNWAATQGTVQTPLGLAQLHHLSTDIRDNQLIVSATAETGGLSVPVDAAATASVQSGTVQVHVVQAHINGLDVPDGPRSQIEQQLQSQLAQTLTANHVSVSSVQLADGKLIIQGTR